MVGWRRDIFCRHNFNKKEFANIEVERKFLVDINHLPNLSAAKSSEFVQTYINYSPEMRVRKIDNLYHYLTIKLPKDNIGLSREEKEILITKEEYEELLTKQVGQTIYKTRYEFYENEAILEVDIYSGSLTGLVVVEVEFKNVKKSKNSTYQTGSQKRSLRTVATKMQALPATECQSTSC